MSEPATTRSFSNPQLDRFHCCLIWKMILPSESLSVRAQAVISELLNLERDEQSACAAIAPHGLFFDQTRCAIRHSFRCRQAVDSSELNCRLRLLTMIGAISTCLLTAEGMNGLACCRRPVSVMFDNTNNRDKEIDANLVRYQAKSRCLVSHTSRNKKLVHYNSSKRWLSKTNCKQMPSTELPQENFKAISLSPCATSLFTSLCFVCMYFRMSS